MRPAGQRAASRQRSICHARDKVIKIAWLDHGPNLVGAVLTGDKLEQTDWNEWKIGGGGGGPVGATTNASIARHTDNPRPAWLELLLARCCS